LIDFFVAEVLKSLDVSAFFGFLLLSAWAQLDSRLPPSGRTLISYTLPASVWGRDGQGDGSFMRFQVRMTNQTGAGHSCKNPGVATIVQKLRWLSQLRATLEG
jgi:hypothetical protein